MLPSFQAMFIDPSDRTPLAFDGTWDGDRWGSGWLRSENGAITPVREGIPDFVRADVPGGTWTYERVRALLDNGQYDRNWKSGVAAVTEGGAFSELLREAAFGGHPIVDIASGPGGGAMPAILALSPETPVMVTDSGTPVLHGWRKYLRDTNRMLPACFAGCDVRRLPLASGSAPIITSVGGFSSVSDIEAAWQEAARVLASDGTIYAEEVWIESDGLRALAAKSERFGEEWLRSFLRAPLPEVLERVGLAVAWEEPAFRRRLRPDDNEWAQEAHRLGVEVWMSGTAYRIIREAC